MLEDSNLLQDPTQPSMVLKGKLDKYMVMGRELTLGDEHTM